MIFIRRNFLCMFLLLPVMVFCQYDTFHNSDNNTFVNISEILTEFKDLGTFKSESNMTIDYNFTLHTYGYLLLVNYLGEVRDIEDWKKEALFYAFKAIGYGEEAKKMFNHEVHVQADHGDYWIPVQDQLLDYWKDELRSNDLVLIYVRIHGAINTKENDKWLFVINAFNSNIPDGLWNEALTHFGKGNDVIGLRCVHKLIELYPEDGRNYAMLAYYYAYTGNNSKDGDLMKIYFDKSDSLFIISMNLSPDYSYQYVQRAWLCFNRGDYCDAWIMIEKARKLKDKGIETDFIKDLKRKLSYDDYIKQCKNND